MRQKIANYLLWIAIFLLPWQTVLLYRTVSLPEGPTVYGNLGVYFSELLIVIVFLLRGWPMISVHAQKIVRALYFFLAASFLSLTWSVVFGVSLGFMSHVMVAAMLFLILLDERTNTMSVMRSFVFGLILPCILGWFQYLSGSSPASTLLGLSEKHSETAGVAVVATDAFRSLRAYGAFPHPNIFGGYLAIGILMIGWMVCEGEEGKKERRKEEKTWKYIPLIFLLSSTLILTFSRGAWLALTVSLFAVIVQAFWYKKLIPHRAIPIMSVGLVTILMTIGILNTHVFARFNPALHVEAVSLEERASQYQTFPGVFFLNPLSGVGPGAFVFAEAFKQKGLSPWAYQPMHNVFLLILAELGVIGFAAFGYFIFEIVRLILKHRRVTGGIFAFAFLLSYMLLGCFDHYLFSLWPGLALSILGMSVCVRLAE